RSRCSPRADAAPDPCAGGRQTHPLPRQRSRDRASSLFSRASIVPSIVVAGETLQRGPRIAFSVSLCLCGASGRSSGSSPNLIAGKIMGHANGSLCVTRLTPFLGPRSDRQLSLGRGACHALDSRLLQLCPRRPCAPPCDTARPRKNR